MDKFTWNEDILFNTLQPSFEIDLAHGTLTSSQSSPEWIQSGLKLESGLQPVN